MQGLKFTCPYIYPDCNYCKSHKEYKIYHQIFYCFKSYIECIFRFVG